jgi:hypothetical protein
MRRLIATLVAAAALILAGCGSEDADPTSGGDPDPAGGDPGPTSGDPDSTQSDQAPTVQRVTLTRTGGLAGVNDSWRVGSGDAGHRAVFKAATEAALDDVNVGPGKSPTCCDFFQYTVVVTYTDGDSATYRTYDGGSADPALDRLVDAVLETEPQPTETSAAPR